jgi:hypothetical protein
MSSDVTGERRMNLQQGMRPVYREVQQFRQAWIWALVIAIVGLIWVASVRQLLLHRPLGDRPMPDILLIIFWFIFGIGLPALFLFGKLVTEVRNDGVYIRFSPFHLSFRKIGFEELKRHEVRVYRPIRDYGGWGIRSGSKGKAYNVSGNRGVQLELTNGGRLLIGSQRPEELWQAIHEGAGRR